LVLAECRAAFPHLQFQFSIIKTTGDKLQTAPPDLPGMPGTKGLFTKELEVALLSGKANLAVHSLKDLPTELPDGLDLAAVLPRADARDVLIYPDDVRSRASRRLRDGPNNGVPEQAGNGLPPGSALDPLPPGATVATSSTRRQAQLLATRPDLKVASIRGNVGTRLRKLAETPELHGLVLAAAGLHRLGFEITDDGHLWARPGSSVENQVPAALLARMLPVDTMLPCVGQAAIGLEAGKDDPRIAEICARLNHADTFYCVTAERSFLQAMGGGCLSPVAAYADILNGQLRLRAVSFRAPTVRRVELAGPAASAVDLGRKAAEAVTDSGGRADS
jgi:hydroxymethylbilane synthase